jgi:hypothetical protein
VLLLLQQQQWEAGYPSLLSVAAVWLVCLLVAPSSSRASAAAAVLAPQQ